MKASILLTLAIAVFPARLRAGNGDAPAQARALAAQGRAAHEAGDYGRAIAAFREAYVIAPAPALLFNLAQSYRLQGSCDEAATMYRRYLSSGPDLEARALAETHLATVARCVQARSPNHPLAEPAMPPIPEPPSPADRVPGDVRGERVIAAPGSVAAASGRRHKTVGVAVILGGTAALGIATYYGFRAHAAAEDVERAYAVGASWNDVAERDADGKRAAITARIFGAGGGLALVTGATLVIIGKRAERAKPLAITPGSTGIRVSYTWRF